MLSVFLEAFCQIFFQLHQIQREENNFYRPQASAPGEKRKETKLP